MFSKIFCFYTIENLLHAHFGGKTLDVGVQYSVSFSMPPLSEGKKEENQRTHPN
jgi:hypothetical protein